MPAPDFPLRQDRCDGTPYDRELLVRGEAQTCGQRDDAGNGSGRVNEDRADIGLRRAGGRLEGRSRQIVFATGEMVPFFRAKASALGPPGPYEYILTPAPKRPVDVRFSPSGDALYVVDVGAKVALPAGAGPMVQAFPKTGAVWRIIRE